MKEFRIVVNGKATAWLDAASWTIEDMKQFAEFGNYEIEFR